jgi:hypothetical protein
MRQASMTIRTMVNFFHESRESTGSWLVESIVDPTTRHGGDHRHR